jgi:glycine/D-amino acid oxidase-like deaminating enzyme
MTADSIYDVILVGGGVMGCATAYYLLQADETLRVAVVEMDSTYARSSTILSDGNTRVQFNIKENIQISQYGLEVLADFSETMAVGDQKPDAAFRQQGNLFMISAANETFARQGYALQRSLNCQVAWLAPDQITARFPLFSNMAEIAGGVFGAQDGTMAPEAVLMGYRRKAEALGGHFIAAEVKEIMTAGSQVTGVVLALGGKLQSSVVVNSAGAWCTRVAATAGVDLPVSPVMRQVFVFETHAQPTVAYPLTVFPSGLYLIQEHGNLFMCGKSLESDPVGFDFSTDRKVFTELLWPELVDYVPAFDRLKLIRSWAGLYAMNTFDGNALLGEWPTLSGFYLANGFSGHGLQQCHAVGRYLSELILDRTPQLDLSIFSPRRLLEGKPIFEGHGKLV